MQTGLLTSVIAIVDLIFYLADVRMDSPVVVSNLLTHNRLADRDVSVQIKSHNDQHAKNAH